MNDTQAFPFLELKRIGRYNCERIHIYQLINPLLFSIQTGFSEELLIENLFEIG